MECIIGTILGISILIIIEISKKKRQNKTKLKSSGWFTDVDQSLKDRLIKEQVKFESLIEESFIIPKCTKCNEIVFKIVKFNSQFDCFESECLSCKKNHGCHLINQWI